VDFSAEPAGRWRLRRRGRLPPRFGARVLGVLGVVSFGFLLFTLATSNPFLRLILRRRTDAT
jgi:cytochrome c biogenesis factor